MDKFNYIYVTEVTDNMITWTKIPKLIRERIWINNLKMQDIGTVSVGGNFMVKDDIITKMYLEIINNEDYTIEQINDINDELNSIGFEY